LKTGQQK